MKKLLKPNYLWMAIILLAAIGVYYLIGLATIVVDASHIPAAVTVHGVHFKLDKSSCTWKGGNYAYMEVVAKGKSRGPRITQDGFYGIVEGKNVKSESNGTTRSDNNPTCLGFDVMIPVKKTTKKFDLVCPLQFNTYGSKRKIEFHNILPSSLPMTKKAGPVSVTLERAFYGKSPKEFGGWTSGYQDRFFIVVSSLSGPSDNFRAQFKLKRNGSSYDENSLKPFWHNNDSYVQVSDESGNRLNFDGSFMNESNKGAWNTFDQETHRRTLTESLVSKINRPIASNMITNRAMQKAQAYPRKFQIAEYYVADHAPKCFTWKTEINMPPIDRQQCTIIFKNIPVPLK